MRRNPSVERLPDLCDHQNVVDASARERSKQLGPGGWDGRAERPYGRKGCRPGGLLFGPGRPRGTTLEPGATADGRRQVRTGLSHADTDIFELVA
jgi:hypothetical protein